MITAVAVASCGVIVEDVRKEKHRILSSIGCADIKINMSIIIPVAN